MKKTILKGLALAVLGMALAAGSAWAIPTLTLNSGGSTIVATDGNGDGVVNFSGAVGDFSISVTTGLTMPAIGSASEPQIDLNSVDVSSTAGSLNITFYADGFGPLGFDPYGFTSAVGGTTGGTVNFATYYNDGTGSVSLDVNGDGAFTGFENTFTLMSDLGTFSPIAFSGTENFYGSPGTPFALAIVADITHSAGGQVTSFDAQISPAPVPEPATMLLFGTGLVGLAGIGRKRMKKA